MTGVSLERQIAAVRREIGMRKRVYPRWVAQSKMTQAEADAGIAAMEAVRETLEQLAARQTAMTQPSLAIG